MIANEFNQLLEFILTREAKISDINFSPGRAPQAEINGQLAEIPIKGMTKLTTYQTELIAMHMMKNDREHIRKLLKNGSVDLSYSIPGKTRFRVNVFSQRGTYAIVMRVIPNGIPSIDDLGLPPAAREISKDRNGIVLVTGPTGSGKTTTLYASLGRIDTAGINVLTVEDPIEYELAGIGQTQVNARIDLTFGKALRAILRQDPDVIMIGEIRDFETAQIAIQASLTGHLVLATLHTNDAPSAITRLIDMGVEPYLLSSSLLGAQAQRLVRKLCATCKRQDSEGRWHPVGCPACSTTGYKGRTGVYELMVVDESLRWLIHSRAAESELLSAARAGGFVPMREDGERLVAEGVTSLEEVLRVTRD